VPIHCFLQPQAGKRLGLTSIYQTPGYVPLPDRQIPLYSTASHQEPEPSTSEMDDVRQGAVARRDSISVSDDIAKGDDVFCLKKDLNKPDAGPWIELQIPLNK